MTKLKLRMKTTTTKTTIKIKDRIGNSCILINWGKNINLLLIKKVVAEHTITVTNYKRHDGWCSSVLGNVVSCIVGSITLDGAVVYIYF